MTAAAATASLTIAPLAPIDRRVRDLDTHLWALLTKPEPLTADEWAYIEAREALAEHDAA